MTTFRKAVGAVIATMIVTTSVAASFDSAKAQPRGGLRNQGIMFNGNRGWGHRGWGHRGHHGHHGHRGFNNGMAIGLGIAIIGRAIIAAQQAERERAIMSRSYYRTAIAKPRNRVANNEAALPKRKCKRAEEWAALVATAELSLAKDKDLNARFGEKGHSHDHIAFAEQEVARRKEEQRRAQERCDRQAAR